MDKVNYISMLDSIDVCVLVLNKSFSKVFYNRSFQDLMALASHEFGDQTTATTSFIDACKSHVAQAKTEWLMRLNVDQPEKMALLRVSKFEYVTDSKDIHMVYTITVDRKSKVNTLEIQGSKVFIFGKLRVDVVNQVVYLGRKLVLLSPTEFQVLCVFCRMPSTLIQKEHLLKSVWNRRSIGTRILDVYIGRLNKKLRDKGGPDYSIQNVHSRGYMFLTQLF